MEHLSCGPASGEELPENIIPACCLWGGNIFQHLTRKIASGHRKEGGNGRE